MKPPIVIHFVLELASINVFVGVIVSAIDPLTTVRISDDSLLDDFLFPPVRDDEAKV